MNHAHPAEQYDVFRPPPPPTGPEAKPYEREDNRPEAFAGFVETKDGKAFMYYASVAARTALKRGERRFSVLGYIHEYRALHRVKIDNTFAPWVADTLVGKHPELLSIIERRARKTAGAVV
ncbi:MAG: hypothetical protein IIC63_05915 [Proteobacteria bacterium]|nr:hypothetical protein [Pseudomonadota bacterium]